MHVPVIYTNDDQKNLGFDIISIDNRTLLFAAWLEQVWLLQSCSLHSQSEARIAHNDQSEFSNQIMWPAATNQRPDRAGDTELQSGVSALQSALHSGPAVSWDMQQESRPLIGQQVGILASDWSMRLDTGLPLRHWWTSWYHYLKPELGRNVWDYPQVFPVLWKQSRGSSWL